MTAWAEDRRLAASERAYEIQQGLTVLCTEPGCGAGEGADCRNVRTGKPLEHQVMHLRRIRAGQQKALLEAQLERERAAAVESGGPDDEQ